MAPSKGSAAGTSAGAQSSAASSRPGTPGGTRSVAASEAPSAAAMTASRPPSRLSSVAAPGATQPPSKQEIKKANLVRKSIYQVQVFDAAVRQSRVMEEEHQKIISMNQQLDKEQIKTQKAKRMSTLINYPMPNREPRRTKFIATRASHMLVDQPRHSELVRRASQYLMETAGRGSAGIGEDGRPLMLLHERPSLMAMINAPKRPSQMWKRPRWLSRSTEAVPEWSDQYDAGYYAGIELKQLFNKPWDLGGHARNFCGTIRSYFHKDYLRDPYIYYEPEPERIEWHERLVAKIIAWARMRDMEADMLRQLAKLHSIVKERRKFQKMRADMRLPLDPAIVLARTVLFPESYRELQEKYNIPGSDDLAVKLDMLGKVEVTWRVLECPHFALPLIPCRRAQPDPPPEAPVEPPAEENPLYLHDPVWPVPNPAVVLPELLELDAFDVKTEAAELEKGKKGKGEKGKEDKGKGDKGKEDKGKGEREKGKQEKGKGDKGNKGKKPK